jgi:hypothetical protein
MCEIPNNVILIDQFARLFDGFSIASNNLTQLTLGVDRDSDIVAFDVDERDPGMLQMFTMAVTGAKRNRRHVGICSEAPANYPEIARFLTDLGIDSITGGCKLSQLVALILAACMEELQRLSNFVIFQCILKPALLGCLIAVGPGDALSRRLQGNRILLFISHLFTHSRDGATSHTEARCSPGREVVLSKIKHSRLRPLALRA